MIKNLIFDIGNVLTNYRWKEFLADYGYSEEMIQRIAAAVMLSPQWNETDRGLMNREELIALFIKNDPEIAPEIRRVLANTHGLVAPVDYAIPWVKEWKEKGYGVYYLSNFSEMARAECADALQFVSLMDGGIFSYEDKVIKPDPAIYELMLKRYQLDPQECVFLDDTQKNVDAAIACGMHSILFTTKEAAIADLKALGVS